MNPHLTIALVGNPNCGKTTLFNALTGARQTVGNWPGVTVERKSGYYHYQQQLIEVVDLPGVYSMDAIAESTSLDQKVTHDYVLSNTANLIVNIIDAANLERNLYLTVQLLELGHPMVVALNMLDVATSKGMQLAPDILSTLLGCPVIPMNAHTGSGVDTLQSAIHNHPIHCSPIRVHYPKAIQQAIQELTTQIPSNTNFPIDWLALKLLEGDVTITNSASTKTQDLTISLRSRIETELGEEIDILTADTRYQFIGTIAQQVIKRTHQLQRNLTQTLDRILLNRWLGLPIFLSIIYAMFLFTINFGGAFIDFFDQLFSAILVQGLGAVITNLGAPTWFTVLIADGVGGGVKTVATFIPIIGFLFLFLSFLEDSGYMARAAFIMDRLMRIIGLPGKSFIPLIVGFGCNVPAIMATRTLEHHRDRLITMAMSPFMSCGARLPVYALFAAAFFPIGGQNVVFLLYLIGIIVAIVTALILKRTLLPGEGAPFIIELPSYHLPTLTGMAIHTWERLKGFIMKAGKIIVPMVLMLNLLSHVGTDGSFGQQNSENSILAAIGKTIVPIFSPFGLQEHNWPAAVGIFSGILAKEAVVGTLDTLYSQQAMNTNAAGNMLPLKTEFVFGTAIVNAFATIPKNLMQLGTAIFDPLGLNIGDVSSVQAAAMKQQVRAGTFGAMAKAFDGPIGAFAYLLLILLYFPCVAVLGAIYREAGIVWASFVTIWSTVLGFSVATFYYQIATFALHPIQSLAWGAGIFLMLNLALYAMKRIGEQQIFNIKNSI